MNKKLIDIAENTRPVLREEERSTMRSDFMAYMDANPATTRGPVPSPFVRFRAAYAFVLILFVITPVLYAAERALPNDTLYSLKVNVLEPVVVSTFSLTKEGAADAKSALITRRFAEAQALVAQDELGEEESVALVGRISTHVADLQTYIEATESEGNLSEALTVGSQLELALEGYGHALTAMSDVDPGEASDSYVDRIVSALAPEGEETEEASEDIEDVLAGTPSEEAEEYLSEVSEDATQALKRAREELAQVREASALIEEAQVLIEEAEDAYSAGESSRLSGVPGSALSEYRDAYQAAERSRILLEAADSLEEEE